jgi:hypothetical protein
MRATKEDLMHFIRTISALAALSTFPAVSAVAASANTQEPTLEGRAVLPAESLAPGPPSGTLVTQGVVNEIQFPRPSQAVAGFSAIVAGRAPGEYLAMPDNGFGGKANSRDFLIRAYYIAPDFKTAGGGTGNVEVRDFISFRDPNRRIGFEIVNEATSDRLLTGGDIDPESLQRDKNGDYWVGDEFGPWILHFDQDGILLDPPFPMPGGLMSPNNPFLVGAATQPNSRGIEAMAISPNGSFLYAVLEGATVADTDQRRRLVFEFSVDDESFTGRVWQYRTEQSAHMVADVWALDQHRLVLIERDGGRGLTALFRNVYVVDVRSVDSSGFLEKNLAVDLTKIPDPNLISLPPIHTGDLGLGNPFWVMCESVEVIHAVSGSRLIVGCDNNLPNLARHPTHADDNEFIVIKVPGLPN